MSDLSDAITDEAFEASLIDDLPQDVPATDKPASSGESVEAAPEADPPEPTKTPDADKPAEETVKDVPKIEAGQEAPPDEPAKNAELLDWKSAPESFREKYDEIKKEAADLRQNSLKDKFFTDSDGFLADLNGLSTSQYQQTAQTIVKRSIDAMPAEFAAYLAEIAPDAVVKTLSGMSPDALAETLFGAGMSAQKAQKIIAQVKAQDLESFLDSEDGSETVEDVKTPKPKSPPTANTNKVMTPDEIETLVSKRIADAGRPQQVQELGTRIFSEIMKPVETLLSEAQLTPSDTDSAEEREYKDFICQVVRRDTSDFLMENEKNKPRATKLFEFIDNLDESGAKHLATTAAILAEEYVAKRIQMLTMQRAKTRSKGTEPKKAAPAVISSSAAIPAFGNPTQNGYGRIGDISESDFESVGL